MKTRIEKGDTVTVLFTSSPKLEECEVLYVPQATGDSWILRDKLEDLHYVQLFERMSLVVPFEELPF